MIACWTINFNFQLWLAAAPDFKASFLKIKSIGAHFAWTTTKAESCSALKAHRLMKSMLGNKRTNKIRSNLIDSSAASFIVMQSGREASSLSLPCTLALRNQFVAHWLCRLRALCRFITRLGLLNSRMPSAEGNKLFSRFGKIQSLTSLGGMFKWHKDDKSLLEK